jgi:TorA maturation chaperone TorD
MSTTLASTAPAPERLARADLCRFVAACYYEPGAEFAEERLFESMHAVAGRLDANLAGRARRLGETFAAETLENLLVDYTRLFLGPADILAKPYESVWTAGENDSTAALLGLYAQGGFEVDEGFRELPDHIAAELEFLYLLIHQDAPKELRRRFLDEHLGKWVRPFAQAVEAGAQTLFYRELAQLTERVVAAEANRLR